MKSRFKLRFIGHIEEPRFREALLQLGDMVELKGFLPQHEALAAMNETDYVLLINHDPLNVGGKFYDYIGGGKPILGTVHPEGETRRLLEELRAGWWAGNHDIEGIRQLFLDAAARGDSLLEPQFQPDMRRSRSMNARFSRNAMPRLLHSIAGRQRECGSEAHAAAASRNGRIAMLKIAVVTRYFPSSARTHGRAGPAYQTLRVACMRRPMCGSSIPTPRIRPCSSRGAASYDQPRPFLQPAGCEGGLLRLSLPCPWFPGRSTAGWPPACSCLTSATLLPIYFQLFSLPDGYAALKIGKALSVPVVAMSIGSDINRIGDPISAMHTRTVLREADFLLTVSDDLRQKSCGHGCPAGEDPRHHQRLRSLRLPRQGPA